jgi:hypothetical protein
MSMELLVVLSLLSAPSQDEWQNAIDNLDIPVKIVDEVNLKKHSGFLPITLGEKDTGFYFDVAEHTDITAKLTEKLTNTDVSNYVVYSLGYGGHFYESAAAFYSAAALASTFGGLVFEPQGEIIMGFEELIEAAKISHKMAENE